MHINFKFDPLKSKTPRGVITKDNMVNFLVEADCFDQSLAMFFCVKKDGDEFYQEYLMRRLKNGFDFDFKFDFSGHYFYHFKAVFGEQTLFICKTFDCYSYVSEYLGEDFFQLVTEEDYVCTNSMQGGIIYQIFVDRFCKVGDVDVREPLIERSDWGGKIKKNSTDPLVLNREVFCGNFAGVESKLDYLKDLGVTVIYFNPVCMANSNHKYDTANYEITDPMFGDLNNFEKLIKKAKEKGIKIIIDGVYNHTGSDSIYFNKKNRFDSVGAFNSKNSKYFGWFDFECYPDKYRSWWGIDTLPAVKENSNEFAEYIAGDGGIIEKYMKLGVFGVRLDVVDEIKDDFVKKISNKVGQFGKDRAIVGEIWEDASTKISYSQRRKYFSNNEINSVMNYPIKSTIINFVKSKEPTELVSTIRMLQNNYPKVVQDNLMNFLSTHDTGRIFSELEGIAGGDESLSKKYFKICMGLVFTVMGVPSIYYGDEYGMKNNDDSSRGCFDWNGYKNDLFEWTKSLTKIRKLDCLKDGELEIIYSKSGKFIFQRTSKTSKVVVCVNLRPSPIFVNVDDGFVDFFDKKPQKSFLLNENEIKILIQQR